eukprot:CAMPEP_0184041738 /NCGR_PEP_ID=MMETSP0955-20130417/63854_1 /TAXON_ID=627963 /ORGANISM="Aplanochytrium sp, Strain PBS07" /LENGTH=232 /DNA_ID=CAMNT_0026332207 /DNA_START=186 /DNA_END=880 /DNA_ORIENTATION=+
MSKQTHTCKVYMVRHGERIDETRQADEWFKNNMKRWFDPPLTERGKAQARAAAEKLITHFESLDSVPFDRVYASPLLRTMQTADQIAQHLSLPIEAVPGIATCTSNFKKHGARRQPLLSYSEIIAHIDSEVNEFDHTYKYDFHNTLELIAQQEILSNSESTEHNILVVTHREGQRDTSHVAKDYFVATPYCGIALFDFTCSVYTGKSKSGKIEKGVWSLIHKPNSFENHLQS